MCIYYLSSTPETHQHSQPLLCSEDQLFKRESAWATSRRTQLVSDPPPPLRGPHPSFWTHIVFLFPSHFILALEQSKEQGSYLGGGWEVLSTKCSQTTKRENKERGCCELAWRTLQEARLQVAPSRAVSIAKWVQEVLVWSVQCSLSLSHSFFVSSTQSCVFHLSELRPHNSGRDLTGKTLGLSTE